MLSVDIIIPFFAKKKELVPLITSLNKLNVIVSFLSSGLRNASVIALTIGLAIGVRAGDIVAALRAHVADRDRAAPDAWDGLRQHTVLRNLSHVLETHKLYTIGEGKPAGATIPGTREWHRRPMQTPGRRNARRRAASSGLRMPHPVDSRCTGHHWPPGALCSARGLMRGRMSRRRIRCWRPKSRYCEQYM